VQYRVGSSGNFANAPGGYVPDATEGGVGPDAVANGASSSQDGATLVTHVRTSLPPAVDGRPLVQVRVLTTNAIGRDEWVGIDDIEVTAEKTTMPGCGETPWPGPAPAPSPAPNPWPVPGPVQRDRAPDPRHAAPELTGLALVPESFTAARRGPAIVRRGRAGASLRFRLSKPAMVRFRVTAPGDEARPDAERGRFQVRGRRGLNRMRFTGRVRGRPLADGGYLLSGVAVDRAGRRSGPAVARFRVGTPEDRGGTED
jgi:hypothetical protein